MRSLFPSWSCLRTRARASARSRRFHLRLEQLEARAVASVTPLPSMLLPPTPVETSPALLRTTGESTPRPGSDPCPNCGLRVDSTIVTGLAVGGGSQTSAGLQPSNRLSVGNVPSNHPVISGTNVEDPVGGNGAQGSVSGFASGGIIRPGQDLPTLGGDIGGRIDGLLGGVSNTLDGMRDRFLGSGGLRDNPDGGSDGSENSGSGEQGSPDGGPDGGSGTGSDDSEDEEDYGAEDESLYWPEDDEEGVWHPGSNLDGLQPDSLSSAAVNAAFTTAAAPEGFVFRSALA